MGNVPGKSKLPAPFSTLRNSTVAFRVSPDPAALPEIKTLQLEAPDAEKLQE